MLENLPLCAEDALAWEWADFAPYYAELAAQPLSAETVATWLTAWSRVASLASEVGARLRLAYDLNTADAVIEARYFHFVAQVAPELDRAEHGLDEKLLASGLEPAGMTVTLRRLRADAALFREENLALQVEEQQISSQYDKIVGAQTVAWEGEERPLPQLRPLFSDRDRSKRERAWRLMHERQLADRARLNQVWQQLLPLRQRIAANAGHADYRSYQWQSYHRFDYTPEDCATFQRAIEEVCVPAANRIYARHRDRLGLTTLRPWDLLDGEWGRPAPSASETRLQPYRTTDELLQKSLRLFAQLDSELAADFQTMISEKLLDVENRKGKAPGGYCTYFATARRPFIFMNAVGVPRDVNTILHEAGHAFHAFAKGQLPYRQQMETPMEFNEVASMSMELLAAPYLAANGNGFYTPAEAARAHVQHLEEMIFFWPYMAVVDAFQHWAYTDPQAAVDPANCDAQWQALWQRFLPAVDWSGLENEMMTGWQRKLHIFRVPFYYVEYGLASMGAAQVWRNARADQATALQQYRRALALGGAATLPDLFATAGARFAFDEETMREIVGGIEETILSV